MVADYGTIVVAPRETDERIRHVQLGRPERNNVLGHRMVTELYDAIVDVDRDTDVRAIVLGTTGEEFCAGADLHERKENSIETGGRFLTGYFETMDLLRETGKPTVAAVEGTCVAGGNELVNVCALTVAGDSTRFGQPEVLVGSTAAGGALQMLPLLGGEEAERIGLVNCVVPDADVEAETVSLVADVVDRSSPRPTG